MDANAPRNRGDLTPSLWRTTDYARRLLRRAQLGLAALAAPVAVTVGVVVTSQDPDHATSETASAMAAAAGSGTVHGMVAGVSSVACCWALLYGVGTIWRRRLDEQDRRAWAQGWARVEPIWTGRTIPRPGQHPPPTGP